MRGKIVYKCTALLLVMALLMTSMPYIPQAIAAGEQRIINGSFEPDASNLTVHGTPFPNAGGHSYDQIKTLTGWNTTASDGNFELFDGGSGHHLGGDINKPNSIPDGKYAAELSAREESSLFQLVDAQDESHYLWGLTHRARLEASGTGGVDINSAKDTMALVIGENVDNKGAEYFRKGSAKDRDIFQKMVDWAKAKNLVNVNNIGEHPEPITIYSKALDTVMVATTNFDDVFTTDAGQVNNYPNRWTVWVITSGAKGWYNYGSNFSADNNAIGQPAPKANSFVYEVNKKRKDNKIVFAFTAISSAYSSGTMGNLLDAISFKISYPLETTIIGGGKVNITVTDDGATTGQTTEITGNQPNNPIMVNENAKVDVSAPAGEGEVFCGFMVDDMWIPVTSADIDLDPETGKYTYTIPGTVNQKITLKAVFTPALSVTYNANTNAGDVGPTSSFKFADATDELKEKRPGTENFQGTDGTGFYSKSAPELTDPAGWKFLGWYDGNTQISAEKNISALYKQDSEAIPPSAAIDIYEGSKEKKSYTQDVTLTAKWSFLHKATAFTRDEANPGTFNESTEGGTVVVSSAKSPTYTTGEVYAEGGDSVTFVATAKTGYKFLGWYDGDKPVSEEINYTLNATDKQTLTLGGRFAKTYTVKFDLNNGALTSGDTISDQTDLVIGDKVVKPTPVPERKGYTFVGWSSTVDDATTKWDFGNDTINGNMTLYALWEPAEGTAYKVEHYFQELGGKYPATPKYTDSLTGKTGDDTAAAAKTEKGFTAKPFAQQKIAGDGTTTIRIEYERQKYTITYEPGFTSGPAPVQDGGHSYGGTAPTVKSPEEVSFTRTGWVFIGWIVQGTTTEYNPGQQIANLEGDITLVAQWTQDVVVTIRGEEKTVVYNGQEQTASAYTVTVENASPDAVDVTQINKKVAKGTDAGTYDLILDKGDFDVQSNFTKVTVRVINGYLKIKPIDVTIDQGGDPLPDDKVAVVEIVGNIEELEYNGKEQTVEGFTFRVINNGVYENFTAGDVTVKLKAGALALAKGTESGEYLMKLSADDFDIVAPNFAGYKIRIKDGRLTIKGTTPTSNSTSDSTSDDGNNPDTGDDSNYQLWIMAMLLSSIGASMALFRRKKRSNEEM